MAFVPPLSRAFLRTARPFALTTARRLTSAPLPARRAPLVARQQLDAQGREYIRLDGFLKVQGLAATGGQAKMLIQDGMVDVNGETEVRRGKKLHAGDAVQLRGDERALEVVFE